MAPLKANQAKIRKACKAMSTYGISAAKVRSALKDLLKVYENNWIYIEEDDYKVLLDVVLEPDGPKTMEIVKHDFKLLDEPEDEEEQEETLPLKRKPRLTTTATTSTTAGCFYENEENLLCLEYNNMDSEVSMNEDENENKNEDVTRSSCSEIDIASSLNGEVKLTFSICKQPPGFQIPNLDAVVKHVDDIYQEKFGTEFSLSHLLKDVCQCFMEHGNSSDPVGDKIPSFDNFKEPEKQGGPTNDAMQISRFVVSSEFDHFGKKLRKQQMVGTDELSGSSSLTIFSNEESTVDHCMEQRNALDHVGDKVPAIDNFKEIEKQGGPANDLMQISRFVVSSEFDHCLSGKLQNQQMIGSDELSSSLTIFPNEQLTVDFCMEQENALDHVVNKIPSFDNFKEPEKQGGPTNDPMQIPRFVVSSEFDHCLSEKLKKQPMIGTDELSCSSSLTIFQSEQSTVDLCMEQENALDHVGNKIPSFDNFKEPENQGGPTNDPIKIPRFVVSSEFDRCLSEKLRKQQMVGTDELSCSSSLTIFQNEPSTVDFCMEHGIASNHDSNKIIYFDNFKESEKQGGPTNGPIKIPRFVVSSEFDLCLSGKLRKQQMVGTDELSCSSSLTIFQNEQLTVDFCSKHYFVADITRGFEKQEISLVNEVDNEKLPAFTYIKKNVNYKTANVKFMLSRVSDENSCPNCFVDCLSPEVQCACVVKTGGKFAYTTEGLVDEEFLKDCIDMTLKPTKKEYFYCDDCPLERLKKKRKNQFQSGSCKGHLVRKFIKECWYKCGCGFNCGNRVVQRGIQAKLQVFMTPEGKGWGLRTLEDLPKGTFVCEYVGEIVTINELLERNEHNINQEHTYLLLLDADWSSEGFSKYQDALCLDATFFGNIARFINHRCVDANMIEIPVKVESPDHHYYHHAFFTTRDVKAMEELTWDYGIDFNDDNHPVKAFPCKCGSKSCKAVKRYKRSRDKQVIARMN